MYRKCIYNTYMYLSSISSRCLHSTPRIETDNPVNRSLYAASGRFIMASTTLWYRSQFSIVQERRMPDNRSTSPAGLTAMFISFQTKLNGHRYSAHTTLHNVNYLVHTIKLAIWLQSVCRHVIATCNHYHLDFPYTRSCLRYFHVQYLYNFFAKELIFTGFKFRGSLENLRRYSQKLDSGKI